MGEYTDSDSTLPRALFKATFSDSATGCKAALIFSSAASIDSIEFSSRLHGSIIYAS
jgi:hypothetical protein